MLSSGFTHALGLGLIFSLMFSIPVGPNGALFVVRFIYFGRLTALLTALGSVCAGTSTAFASMYFIASFNHQIRRVEHLNLYSGAFFILFALFFLAKSAKAKSFNLNKDGVSKSGYFIAFISSFLVTVVNPKNVLGVSMSLVAVNLELNQTPVLSLSLGFALGVSLGMTSWWATLTIIMTRFSGHVERLGPRWPYRIVSMLLGGMGLWKILS